MSKLLRDRIFRDAWLAGADSEYRYTLSRVWGPGKLVLWCLANPSTADANKDDQTVKKGMGFSRRWGFGGMVFVNLCAMRATNPTDVKVSLAMGFDVVGPVNDDVLRYLAYNLRYVVCAWGDCLGEYGTAVRGPVVKKLITDLGILPCHLGLTAEGNPKHPLTLPYTTQLEMWK